MAAYLSFVQVLTAGAIAAIVELGGRQAIDGAVAPGVVIAFIVYLRTALGPLPSVASLHSLVSQASSGLDRIAALLEHPAEVPDPPAARDLGHVSGEIRFEKAWFAYSDERWVLRSLDLTVRAGETLAIVGTTGAGKSTLVKLLLRFYDPARGRILIDGIELTALRPADLRRVTGYVPQEPFLFSGTVAENLRFARAEASDEEIESALRELGGEEALAALPEGLATQVGERGESLSSGQRQLVALARAMIADPRLLVVDEATSGIDVATERQVQAALDRLSANRTTVVIAHRLSTVRNADRIAVIGRGQVLELGTHDELAALGGEYAELVGLTPRERAGRPEQDSNLRPTP